MHFLFIYIAFTYGYYSGVLLQGLMDFKTVGFKTVFTLVYVFLSPFLFPFDFLKDLKKCLTQNQHNPHNHHNR